MKKFPLLLALLLPGFIFAGEKKEYKQKQLFEENLGQVKIVGTVSEKIPEVRFALRGAEMSYFFTDRGYSVVTKNANGTLNRTDFLFENNAMHVPQGENDAHTNVTYYLSGKTIAPRNFEKIIYHNAWNGCDLEFSLIGNSIKKTLAISGNNYPSSVLFEVKGASWLYDDDGFTFIASTRSFEEQLAATEGNLVPVTKSISRNGTGDFAGYSLVRLGDEVATTSTISWLTYLGGGDADEFFGITVTEDSGAVVTGRTASTNYPSTAGSMQDTLALSYDAAITRFDANGNCDWSTYYGGTGFDGAYGVIENGTSFIVCGMTNSLDLPVMNPTQANNAGGYDAFLVEVNGAGQMVRATYYGGTGSDQGLSISSGTMNQIVVAGSVTSTDLPNTSSGYQNTFGGMIDAFVTLFDSTFQPQWATYYGGNNVEDVHSITVTPQGEIAFTGATRSFNFPVTPNAWQSGLLNQPDVYVVKLGMDGSLHYSTFFGGTGNEDCNGIACDSMGNLYITGFTYSIDFPTQGTCFQSTQQGNSDAFAARFDSTGQLVWSTYLGGGMQDVGWNIFRRGQYVYFCGQTESPTFPVSANAIQSTYANNSDGYIIKMDTTGQMVSGTFMGGQGLDAILAMTVTADTNVIATGDTYSTDLPVTAGAFQPANMTNGDGLVVKFGMGEQLVGTGIPTAPLASPMNVFPNPCSDLLTLNNGHEAISSLEIFDATGRLVKKESANSATKTINVQQLESGCYFVRILSANGKMQVIRFVKK